MAMRTGYMTTVALLVGLCSLGAKMQSGWAQASPCYPEPSQEQRARANELARKAYQLHGKLRYREAAQVYVQALEQVRDARLHLQAGTTFFGALDIVKAFEHLDEALRCGQELFDDDEIQEARRKLGILYDRLGRITIDCRANGAEVALNGEPWFSCPHKDTVNVVAGQYSIEVTKPGHFAVNESRTVSPGEHVILEPRLVSIEEGTLVTRRWPRWQPWALIGGGAALGLVAGSLQWHARGLMGDSKRGLAEDCALTAGCSGDTSEALFRDQDRALLESRIGVGMLAVGGAALATGLTMVFFNRPKVTRSPEAGTARVRLEPMARRDGGGLSLRVGF